MKKAPGEELGVPSRRQASRVARMIGCSGAHQDANGNWLPCSSPEKLASIIGGGESKKQLPIKRRRRGAGRKERLIERGITGIDTLPDGGLVSAPVIGQRQEKGSFRRYIRVADEFGSRFVPLDSLDPEERKGLLGRRRGRMQAERFIRNAIDRDMDGRVQDNTPFERPANPVTQAEAQAGKIRNLVGKIKTRKRTKDERAGIGELFARMKEPEGGFSVALSSLTDAKSGWAIARNGKGIAVPYSDMYDENGNVTDKGRRMLAAFVDMHKDDLFSKPTEDHKVVLGAWHNPDTGMIHLDVTDVHSKKSMTKEEAMKLGAQERQISIADLDKITEHLANGTWSDDATPNTGGDGGEIIDLKELGPHLDKFDKKFGAVQRERVPEVKKGPESVDMMMAEPVADLAAKHGLKRDWLTIVAIDPQRRKEIADLYDADPNLPAEKISEEVKQAYEALVSEVEQQFKMLTEELNVKVEFVENDPYENFLQMREDFLQNRRIKIMKTSVTGSHPFMTDEQNDMFRAVHDAFGHLATGRGFDRHGEEAAYQAHRTMFSDKAIGALATETRGQNVFLLDRGFFGDQKLMLLPDTMQKSLRAWFEVLTKGLKVSRSTAQRDQDADNAYDVTGSHHVTGGRVLKKSK